jgi:hypothetical protein
LAELPEPPTRLTPKLGQVAFAGLPALAGAAAVLAPEFAPE